MAPQKGVIRSGSVISNTPTFVGPGRAFIVSEDPPTDLAFETTGCRVDPPKPKYETTARPGAISLLQWVGQEPYSMTLGIRIDEFPNGNVESDIRKLEALGEVQPGRFEPPIVTVDGAVPKPHPNLTWRITDFGDPEIEYLGSGDRCRYVTTLVLTQNVTDRVLIESLKATSKSKGLKTRETTVRAGEDSLYDVARRYYKDPSRASDIARANNLHLGKKLSKGLTLRMP